MSSDVLGRPGEYWGRQFHVQRRAGAAVKSNLYTSGWVGGSAPGSFSPPRTPQTVYGLESLSENSSVINPTSASNTSGWQQGPVLDAPHDTMNTPLGRDEHSEAQSEERTLPDSTARHHHHHPLQN